jgi:hypothetical protein
MAYEHLPKRYQARLESSGDLIIAEVSPEIYMRYGTAGSSTTKPGAIEILRGNLMAEFMAQMGRINWQARQYGEV